MIHPKTSHLDSWWCQIQLKLLILHKYTDDIIYNIEKLEKFNDDMREREVHTISRSSIMISERKWEFRHTIIHV